MSATAALAPEQPGILDNPEYLLSIRPKLTPAADLPKGTKKGLDLDEFSEPYLDTATFVTVTSIARVFRVSGAAVRAMIKRHGLQSGRFGRDVVVSTETYYRLLAMRS
jgi:hypothetical protein